MRIVKIKFLCW